MDPVPELPQSPIARQGTLWRCRSPDLGYCRSKERIRRSFLSPPLRDHRPRLSLQRLRVRVRARPSHQTPAIAQREQPAILKIRTEIRGADYRPKLDVRVSNHRVGIALGVARGEKAFSRGHYSGLDQIFVEPPGCREPPPRPAAPSDRGLVSNWQPHVEIGKWPSS